MRFPSWSRCSRGFALLVIGFGVVLSEGVTSAQQPLNNIFPPAPRGMRQRLLRAEKALSEQRYSDAVTELGTILSGAGDEDTDVVLDQGQDYFLSSGNANGLQISLKAEVLRLLGNMPEKGRELYELKFGAEARALLEEAVREGDLEKLSDVTRKFFHTAAGYEATMLLGRHHLDQGQPLAAALCFRRLSAVPSAARKLDPELSLLLAACWQLANHAETAREVLVSLKARLPDARVQVGGRSEALFRQESEALAWLEGLIGAGGIVPESVASQWAMYRGNPSRTARTEASAPLANPRWRAPLLADLKDEQIVQTLHKRNVEQGWPALPSSQPLVLKDVVLVRTPDQLVGIDFKTGKRIWEYRWWEDLDDSLPQVVRGEGRAHSDAQRELELQQRVWDDNAYGQVSSDGESVYLLDKLGIAQSGRFGPQVFIRPGGFGRPNPGWPTSYNQLVSLDLRREGALNWTVGDESGWEEPKLAGAFFLGPPLPLHGQLYVLAELNGEIRLVVLDSKSGMLEWSQQIAHVETRPIQQDSVRRLAGSTPSYADGVLICPTSAGAVVAVDLSTRSLLWGYSYSMNAVPSTGLELQPFQTMTNPRQVLRWQDATVTIADGYVLLTPVESAEFHCLELLTGRPAWPPKRREAALNDMLYVACVHEGAAILVGKRGLTAVRLASGEVLWNPPLELRYDQGEFPSGRGLHADHYYYLPTTSSQLLTIDLSSRKIVERVRTHAPLGNLVSYQQEIISLGLDHVSVHYQSEPLRKLVAERLAMNARDPWALARRGELLLQDGKHREAFSVLLAARSERPADDGISSLLVTSYLAALQEDYANTRGFAEQIEPLIVQNDQKSLLLRLLAEGAQKQGELLAALDACLRLAALELDVVADEEGPLEEVRPDLRVHRDRWIQARVAELLAGSQGEQRATMDRRIRARLKEAVQTNSAAALRRFIEQFGGHVAAEEARRQLAVRLMDADEFLESELLLLPLQDSADEATAAAATALLARLNLQAQHYAEAAVYYGELATRWRQTICLAGKTGEQLLEELPEGSPVRLRLAPAADWPDGPVVVQDLPPSDAPDAMMRASQMLAVPLRETKGPLTDVTLVFNAANNTLQVRDPRGETLARVVLLENLRTYSPIVTAKLSGHLLLFSPSLQPIAIDLFRAARASDEAILWPRAGSELAMQSVAAVPSVGGVPNPFEPKNDPQWGAMNLGNPLAGSLGSLSRHGVVYLSPRNLVCADPMTGRHYWTRGNASSGMEVFGDGEVIFLTAPGSRDIQVISPIDGRLLGERKLADGEFRWTARGRNLLVWKQEQNSQYLRLFDLWTQQEIWKEKFLFGSRGFLIDEEEVAVLQPDGRLVIRSLADDRVRLNAALQTEPNLTSLYVDRSDSLYLVAANRPAPGPQLPGGRLPIGWPINGLVYAFHRQSQSEAWPSPALLEGLSVPMDQPDESPLWLLATQISGAQLQRGSRASLQTSIACVDKRSGRLVMKRTDIPFQGSSPDLLVDPQARTVKLLLMGLSYQLQYEEGPRPPEPPAQLTHPSSR